MPSAFLTQRMVVVSMMFVAQACSPLVVPRPSSDEPTEPDPTATLVATDAYPGPDPAAPTLHPPEPTPTPQPTETPFPTRVAQRGQKEVTLPDGNLAISLPDGWYSFALPHEMDIQNYPDEEGGGEFGAGDRRIRIVLSVLPGHDTLSFVEAAIQNEQDAYATEGHDTSGILPAEPVTIAGLDGHSFRITDGPGYFIAFLADERGRVVRIMILPVSSPTFDEAYNIVESLRFP